MTSQEILTEIRSLKMDLDAYADHMVRLRYDDLKAAFLRQMRGAVVEEERRSFQNDATALREGSVCPHKSGCWVKLEEAVEKAADQFMKDRPEEARRTLDEVERFIAGDCSPCQDSGCSTQAAETLRRVRTVLQVYENLMGMLDVVDVPAAAEGGARKPEPGEMEALLSPLANSWRIKVLNVLRTGDRSLTELGRAVDLRTGHLQFHLGGLIEAGFVTLDRRRHRYSITERGSAALGCAEELVQKVMTLPSGPGKREGVIKGGRTNGG